MQRRRVRIADPEGVLRPLRGLRMTWGAYTLALALVSAIVACTTPEDGSANTVCERARVMVASCGASLPLVSQGTCTGVARAVASCITNHVANCDDLASLAGRVDQCIADEVDGGEIPPAEDLALPPIDDAGTDGPHGNAHGDLDAGSAEDAAQTVDADADGTTSSPDASDAALDSAPPPWAGLDVTATVALGVEDRYTTPLLAMGTYTFAITGTGDADLYVKKDSIPKTNTYDCRPYLTGSDETCTLTLTSPATIYVMVRGEATSSTYTLTGNP